MDFLRAPFQGTRGAFSPVVALFFILFFLRYSFSSPDYHLLISQAPEERFCR